MRRPKTASALFVMVAPQRGVTADFVDGNAALRPEKLGLTRGIGAQRGGSARRDGQQARPGLAGSRRAGILRRLFENEVGVGARETERADAGQSRLAPRFQGVRLHRDIEACAFERDMRIYVEW